MVPPSVHCEHALALVTHFTELVGHPEITTQSNTICALYGTFDLTHLILQNYIFAALIVAFVLFRLQGDVALDRLLLRISRVRKGLKL